jgi:hypothetical protein
VTFGQLSPESHWMAYASEEFGQDEVWYALSPQAKANGKSG